MARWTRFIPALAVTLVLAACGQGGTDTPLSPAGRVPVDARFDEGGGTSLGGNKTDPTPSPDASTVNTAEAQSDSTGRTGGTSLGGN
jgi:hypothetical protein